MSDEQYASEARAAIAKMQRLEKEALDGFLTGIARAYKTFLETHSLPDVPVVRLGFYTVVAHIVEEEPYPIPKVQQRLEKSLINKEVEAITVMMTEMADLLMESIKLTKE